MAARCRDCLCITLMDLYILGERWPLILSFDIIIHSVKEKKLKNLLCREEVVKRVLQQQFLQPLVALCLFVGVSQYQNLTPLINLSPKTSNNKWVSKVKVLAKGELRPFHNTRGQGSILDMDLIDQDETTRNIVFWNEDAIHFDRGINTGDTCFLSGTKITESPKKARHPTFNKFEFRLKMIHLYHSSNSTSLPLMNCAVLAEMILVMMFLVLYYKYLTSTLSKTARHSNSPVGGKSDWWREANSQLMLFFGET